MGSGTDEKGERRGWLVWSISSVGFVSFWFIRPNRQERPNELDRPINHSTSLRCDSQFHPGFLLEGVHNPKKVLCAGVTMWGKHAMQAFAGLVERTR